VDGVTSESKRYLYSLSHIMNTNRTIVTSIAAAAADAEWRAFLASHGEASQEATDAWDRVEDAESLWQEAIWEEMTFLAQVIADDPHVPIRHGLTVSEYLDCIDAARLRANRLERIIVLYQKMRYAPCSWEGTETVLGVIRVDLRLMEDYISTLDDTVGFASSLSI
jgi:hypothetical protein